MSPFRRFLMALFLIFLLLAVGVAGYMSIQGWSFGDSLYMTFLTISTVGFREVHPLSPGGRNFTMIFIVVSILTVGFTLTTLISFIFEGQIVQTVKERRMKRFLAVIKDHYIICGFGDVGRESAEEFLRKKIRFVVIDRQVTEQDSQRYPDILFVPGDATEEEVLEEAKIRKARGLVSCLPEDQQNVFTVLTARQLKPELHIVAKASGDRAVKKLEKAGADRVVSPKQIAGRRLASMTLNPGIVNFLEVLSSGGDETMRLESVRIGHGASLIGKSLREANIGQYTGAIIIGILDSSGRARINHDALATLSALELQEGDELVALGNDEQLAHLHKFARST